MTKQIKRQPPTGLARFDASAMTRHLVGCEGWIASARTTFAEWIYDQAHLRHRCREEGGGGMSDECRYPKCDVCGADARADATPMTARERRVRQTEPIRTDPPRWVRGADLSKLYINERTGPSERRVASYRWLIGHAINTTDEISKTAYLDLLAALRRPTVTKGELAEAIRSRQVILRDVDGGTRIGTITPADAAMLARVAVEKLK